MGNFDGILDGILNEIASVALLPRNDGIPYFCAICIRILDLSKSFPSPLGDIYMEFWNSYKSKKPLGILDLGIPDSSKEF